MKNTLTLTILIFLFLCFCTGSANADWIQRNVPKVTNIAETGLMAVGSNFYMGTFSGRIYRSTDLGDSWTVVWESSSGDQFPVCFAGIGSMVFSGGFGLGLLQSSDNGITWLPDTNYSYPTINSLASLNGHLFAGTFNGVYRSTDLGNSWSKGDSGLSNPQINTIAAYGGVLYAATAGGFFRSTDEGKHWLLIRNGLPAIAFATSYVQDSLMCVASIGSGFTNGHSVYISTNLGGSWINPSAPPLGYTNTFVLSAIGGKVFVTSARGLFRLSDDHTKWLQVKGGLLIAQTFSMAVLGSVGLVEVGGSGAGNGVYRTTDGGDRWDPLNFGEGIAQVGVFGSFGSTLYAATDGGSIVKSDDGGSTWKGANIGASIGQVQAFSSNSTYLFAATNGGVYRTSDNGLSWVAAGGGLPSRAVLGITALDTAVYAGVLTGGLYRSTDNGDHWTSVGQGIKSFSVRNILVRDSTLFIATVLQGVFRLRAGETYWLSKNNGVAADTRVLARVGETLLLGAQGGGIYFSTTDADTWSPSYYDETPVYAWSIEVNRWTAYACAYNDPVHGGDPGVFESEDFGASWGKIEDGINDEYFRAIHIVGDYLYLASDTSGIWRRPLSEISSAKEPNAVMPRQFSLKQNYPNPFNPTTTLEYDIPERSTVTLEVYNLLGSRVALIFDNKQLEQGNYSQTFDASHLASGVYFYRLKAVSGDKIYADARKLVLIR